MRSRDDLHGYQKRAVDFVRSTPACALWISMGLGKSVITLTAVADLLASFDVHRVLIIAPLRVALTTWPAELREWSHVSDLTACVLAGQSPRTRSGLALTDTADLHIINRELVPWLVQLFRDAGQPWPYDMVVIDEASSFKSHRAQRFKALRKVLPRVSRMVQLTGTPTSNGLLDLWAQIFLLDRGARLGRAYTKFQQTFFDADYMGFQLTPREGAEAQIHSAVSDIVLSMSAADYLDLPPVVVNDISVTLPDAARTIYATLERDFLVEIEDETVGAFSAAALTGKLLQAANGAVYADGNGAWSNVHDAKIDALAEIVESTGGAPLLVAYNFRSDVARIVKRFPQAEVLGEDPGQIERWNNGEIAMLVAHPACLHPDTEVLTQSRGWVRLVDVRKDERVFDGVEFVAHSGCAWAGRKPIIERFGVRMTPDHKILVQGVWMEARHVGVGEDARRAARYYYAGDDSYLGEKLPGVDLRYWTNGDEGSGQETSDVFDLVDCGPRSRFLIRNARGEAFISHNSAGHGLNLQHGGRHAVWFGLNWSLELYQQFNARLARQGQTERVIIHRIIAEDTIDRAVVGSVTAKGVTQAALLAAVKQDAAARRNRVEV